MHAAVETTSPPPELVSFVQCFNNREFFAAHDVLEALWLRVRGGEDAEFFKGLIQFAGAFVHVQKERRSPALALLALARPRLAARAPAHLHVDVERTVTELDAWIAALQDAASPLASRRSWPRIDWCQESGCVSCVGGNPSDAKDAYG